MSKLVLLLAICCLCLLQVQANPNTCGILLRQCLNHQHITGTTDDVTNFFNLDCRREIRNWKNVTRCQLEHDACELSLNRCLAMECANVDRLRIA